MGVVDPAKYEKFKPLICEAIREVCKPEDDWLSDVSNVLAMLRHDGLTDETEAAMTPYVSFFFEQARQGLVHPFSDAAVLPGTAQDPAASSSPSGNGLKRTANLRRWGFDMTEDITGVSLDGLVRLQSAAHDFASAEAKRILRAVIEDMRGRPAQGIFGDVAARHMWDEYCWSLQEGPFDDDMGWDNVQLGSLSGAFDGMVRAVIEAEIEKLPRHAQVFLSAKAIKDDFDMDEDALGSIWLDGMVALIIESVNSEASGRNLDLIGPERGDVISYEIEGSGTVWSVLSDRGEAMDLIQSHVDEMIDADGDLSELAAEMVDAYLAAAKEEADGTTVSEFFDNFEDQIRDMLAERDVLPALEDMRVGLLERLDG